MTTQPAGLVLVADIAIDADYNLASQAGLVIEETNSTLLLETQQAIAIDFDDPANRESAIPAPQPQISEQPTQHKTWRNLIEKPLWIFFAKIREIHRTYPEDQSVANLYYEVKGELFDRYLTDTLAEARRYFKKKMPPSALVHQDDLEEAVQVEMYKYLDRFDPEFGTITFMKFFNAKRKSRLKGSMIDRLRELQDCTRDTAKQRREIKPMFKALAHKLGHHPTIEEFLDEYGWETLSCDGKMTYREILSERAFFFGVFNQRQLASDSANGISEEELESLANQESRPAKNLNRMQGRDSKEYILSFIQDEWINFIIDCYYWQGDTDERICSFINQAGKKCSVSWVAGKRKDGHRILREQLGLSEFKLLAYGQEEE